MINRVSFKLGERLRLHLNEGQTTCYVQLHFGYQSDQVTLVIKWSTFIPLANMSGFVLVQFSQVSRW